jgi:ribosomal protein L7Ae-like RNA K-turn-binding protein
VQKAVRARKARCVVLAPNIEQDEDRVQLEAQLAELHGQALACDIPIVYALTRKKLGQARALSL